MKKILTVLVGGLLLGSHSFAATSQASFTPSSYKYPIMKISIMKSDNTEEQPLYTCSGSTSAACMVDVADDTALATITDAAKNVAIREGTYTKVKLYNCPTSDSTQTTTIGVTGSVDVGGTTYYTSSSATGGMSTTSPAAETSITWACAGASVTLLNPITITAGVSQSLSLLVDLTNTVWTDADASSGMGGCKSDSGAGQDICGAVPLIVPYVGSSTPTFERYLISHLSGAGTPALADASAMVNFGIDENAAVFWVGVQPYYSSTSPVSSDTSKGGPDYNTATRTYSTNNDATIAFQTGGSSEDDRVGFTAFARSTHTGTCKNELASSTTWNYKAYKQ